MFLHGSAGTLRVVVEQEQALGQLSVVQPLGLQHVGSNGLVLACSHQFLDALALVLLAGCIELLIESELLNVVEVLLLEIGGRHVIVGIHKGKHVLEHAAGGTRCRYELDHALACGLVLLPSLDILLTLACCGGDDALADGGCSLQLQKGEACFELA